MTTIETNRLLSNPLGDPDTSLYSYFFQYRGQEAYRRRNSVKDSEERELYRPLADFLEIPFETFLHFLHTKSADIQYEGVSPKGLPVYSIPFFGMQSKGELENILSVIRKGGWTEEAGLPSEQKTFIENNLRSSNMMSKLSSNLMINRIYFDIEMTIYDICFPRHHLTKTYTAQERFITIEPEGEEFILTQIWLLAKKEEDEISVDFFRFAKVSLSDFLSGDEKTPLMYINNKNGVSRTGNFDTLFKDTGKAKTFVFEDEHGNKICSNGLNFYQGFSSKVHPTFFDSKYARFSGLSEHPLLIKHFMNHDEVSFKEKEILTEAQIGQDSLNYDYYHTKRLIESFVSYYRSREEGDTSPKVTLDSPRVSLYSNHFRALQKVFQYVIPEERWTVYQGTPISYLFMEDYSQKLGNHVVFNQLEEEDVERFEDFLTEEEQNSYVSSLTKKDIFYGFYKKLYSNENFLASLQFLNINENQTRKWLLERFRSSNIITREKTITTFLAFLIFWKKNPVIEQILKDQNNQHLGYEFYTKLRSPKESEETSSLKGIGLDKELRDILSPIEDMLKIIPSLPVGAVYYSSSHILEAISFQYHRILSNLREYRENGYTFDENFYEMLSDIMPYFFNKQEDPTLHELNEAKNTLALFINLLDSAKRYRILNPSTLHRYLQRMDLVQAIPYEEALRVWSDYMNLKIKTLSADDEFEYFPTRSLKMYHDIALRQFMASQQEQKNAKFLLAIQRLKSFNLEMKNDEFIIRLPETVKELIEEGNMLGHCVGSYTDAIASGMSVVLFLRRKEEPDTPFITLEINPRTNTLSQSQGRGRNGYAYAGKKAVELVSKLLASIEYETPIASSF